MGEKYVHKLLLRLSPITAETAKQLQRLHGAVSTNNIALYPQPFCGGL